MTDSNPIHEHFLRDPFPSPIADVGLVRNYASCGEKAGPLLYFSLGETWKETPLALREITARLRSPEVHGYLLSPYGYPAFRKTITDYIRRTHDVEQFEFGSGATSLGTRSVMHDFGVWLTHKHPKAKPIAVAPVPSWDYYGVFRHFGFSFSNLPLRHELGFVPQKEDFAKAFADARARGNLALVAINAQHNPTAVNWDPAIVRFQIQEAIADGAAILLDDAYFGVHEPGVKPTSSLKILLEELENLPTAKREKYPWVAVRSLGKQFHCNGWGIGAVSASASTLVDLENVYYGHAYPYGSPLQHVMKDWLESPASDEFLVALSQRYSNERKFIKESFTKKLGYPENRVHVGECTSYSLIAVPKAYQGRPDGDAAFRTTLLEKTGVLLGDESLGVPSGSDVKHVRFYLGPSFSMLEEAIARFEKAGITYY